jgi:hypothetical protein
VREASIRIWSSLPVDAKIDRCQTIYAAVIRRRCSDHAVSQPPDLDDALDRRGYVAFDRTLVQVMRIEASREASVGGASIEAVPVAQFVEAVAAMRTSTPVQRAAHFERLSNTPLATHAVVARVGDRSVACGQVAVDGGLAGIYDMVTAADFRGARPGDRHRHGSVELGVAVRASHAFLQVNDDNAAALAVYRKFGFDTR